MKTRSAAGAGAPDRFRMLTGSSLRALGALGLFALLTVAHTWPLARSLSLQVQDDPDVTTGMWSLMELARQLLRDPMHLMDGNIFYPFPGTLAILDHQLANALLAAPIVAVTGVGAVAYNLMILLTFFLNAAFTWLLVRRLTRSEAAALVAGCAFAFSSFHAYHLTQPHLLATQWLPFALLMLHRYLERPTWPRWGAFAAATLLVALSSWHTAIIGALAIGVAAVWSLVADPVQVRRRLAELAIVAVLCVAVLLPLARAYSRIGALWPPRTGEGRETMGTLVANSAALGDIVAPAFNSRAPYAAALEAAAPDRSGIFPGIVLLLLAGVAVTRLWQVPRPDSKWSIALRWWLRTTCTLAVLIALAAWGGESATWVVAMLRPTAPFVWLGLTLAVTGLLFVHRAGRTIPDAVPIATYTALAAAGLLLALGPRVHTGSADLGSGLWRLDLLPLQLLIRAPDRLSLLLMLGIAVLAGFGTARLISGLSPGRRAVLVAAILMALNLDLAFRMTSLRPVPVLGETEHWLATAPAEGAVIEYPLERRRHVWALHLAQIYDRRTVNGAGYLFPWEYREMERVPDLTPPQLALLWEHFHPKFLVIRSDLYAPAERRRVVAAIERHADALRQRAQFGGDYIVELIDRGRDTELYRRWPRPELQDKRSLHLGGFVTSGREDTVAELAVALNGNILLQARGDVAESPNVHEIPFATEDLRNGNNVFLIWADYRFTETSVPYPIGTTGVSLPADVSLRADRDRARVQVNGRVFRPDKGYFLAVLDPYTGEVVDAREFNVSWYAEDSEAMAAFIREIPLGSPVIAVTEFDASRELTASAAEALNDLGMETDLRGQFQLLHAAIGVKGAPPGSALEATDPVRATLALGEPVLRQVQLTGLELRD